MSSLSVQDIINYIFQNMFLLAEDLSLLKAELESALAEDTVQMSPELRRILSGYLTSITRYASVMGEVCRMLETGDESPDTEVRAVQTGIKQ